MFSVVPRDRNTFQTETHTSSLATYRNNSESSSISAPELEDTRSPLSALSDELVTFRSVLWPALIVLSADRPCNLWPGSTDGHNQQRRVTLIHWGGTAYSGINTHTHTHTNIYEYIHTVCLGTVKLILSTRMSHEVPMLKKGVWRLLSEKVV